MPYSGKAERFFRGCAHNPKHVKGKCPAEGFLGKFGREKAAGMETKDAKVEGQRKALRSMG